MLYKNSLVAVLPVGLAVYKNSLVAVLPVGLVSNKCPLWYGGLPKFHSTIPISV